MIVSSVALIASETEDTCKKVFSQASRYFSFEQPCQRTDSLESPWQKVCSKESNCLNLCKGIPSVIEEDEEEDE